MAAPRPGVFRAARRTLRTQLALLYAGVFSRCGAALLAVPIFSRSVHGSCRRRAGHRPRSQRQSLRAATARRPNRFVAMLGAGGLAAVGWLIAGRLLRPLRTITATARDISATNLNQRLALDGPTTSSPSSANPRRPVRAAGGLV